MLMRYPQAAQLHFMEGLQLIKSCSKREIWMESAYQTGEFAHLTLLHLCLSKWCTVEISCEEYYLSHIGPICV